MPDEIQAHCLSDLCPNISLFTTNKSTPSSSASRRERTHQIGGALPQEVRQRKVRTGIHRDGHSPAKPNGTGLPGAHRGRPARRKRLAVKGKGLPIWRKRPDLEPPTEDIDRLPPFRRPNRQLNPPSAVSPQLGPSSAGETRRKPTSGPPRVRATPHSPHLSEVAEPLLSDGIRQPRLPLPASSAQARLSSLAIGGARRVAVCTVEPSAEQTADRDSFTMMGPVRSAPAGRPCRKRRRRVLSPRDWEPVAGRDGGWELCREGRERLLPAGRQAERVASGTRCLHLLPGWASALRVHSPFRRCFCPNTPSPPSSA